ncbi:hypothetical protein [Bosea sp. 124]|uniref:hypothetical protein n=1 Tax=Bosea sp. 124 TaxID=2135642 RepID=UPI000D45C1D4|nr:hypothetical protein [Bosea sp. 124]PTM41105.1 hypothetical protein C8D03_2639 [Bosea sp. 124]
MFMPVLALLGTSALALWLAFSDAAIYALPLVVIIAGLVRHLIRQWTGRRYRVSDLERSAGNTER